MKLEARILSKQILGLALMLLITQQSLCAEAAAADTPTPPAPEKRYIEVPQVVGRKYVVNLTESTTDNITSEQTILLLGASYDPDTRHYLPDFFILAYWIHKDPQYTGSKWQVAYYDVRKLQHKRDELMKRLDVYTLPQIIIIRDGKYWVYNDDKNRDKTMEFIETKLLPETAKVLPSHVSDLHDSLRSIWREIYKAFEITARENPEVFNQIKIGAIVLTALFTLLLVYALFGKKDSTADKKDQ